MLTKQEKAIMLESILRLYRKVEVWTDRDMQLVEQLKQILEENKE